MKGNKPEWIELFPLSTVLFPNGLLPLRGFETRYLDLVSWCLKTDSGFGVALIESGDEVHRSANPETPELKTLGCFGAIVSWDGLPNNHLAITVEGRDLFKLRETRYNRDTKRMQGRVDWLQTEEQQPLEPLQQQNLVEIYEGLIQHPSIQTLNYPALWQSSNGLSFALAQLLPISSLDKYKLLEMPCAQRVQALEELIQGLGGR